MNIDVYKRNDIIVIKILDFYYELNLTQASYLQSEIKRLLDLSCDEHDKIEPITFFLAACDKLKNIDPAEEHLEFEFCQELLNAYKNYRVKQETYPFSNDEMPLK